MEFKKINYIYHNEVKVFTKKKENPTDVLDLGSAHQKDSVF